MGECRVSPGRRAARSIDGCVVRTSPLASVVQEWVDRYDRAHPDLVASRTRRQRVGAGSRRSERGHLSGNEAVGAVRILHERTRLLEARPGEPPGSGVPTRTIYNVLARSWRFTELRTADLLVQAIEEPHAFHDGRLEVEPNPKAPPAARAACCGGAESLLGV